MDAILVMITAGDADEANSLAEALLHDRLVACVNQVPAVEAQYWWQGAREAATETLLLAKTRRDLWPRVLDAIRANHSYQVFEAIAVPIIEGNPDYLRWIQECTCPNPDD